MERDREGGRMKKREGGEESESESKTSRKGRDIERERGRYMGDPYGYWWPPTFSNWLKTFF
jgi:hypothetical protein